MRTYLTRTSSGTPAGWISLVITPTRGASADTGSPLIADGLPALSPSDPGVWFFSSRACVVRRGGDLLCWSRIRRPDDRSVPGHRPPVPVLRDVTSVDGGRGAMCAIAGEVLLCWGYVNVHWSFLNLGPRGLDRELIPHSKAIAITFRKPRRVMSVPRGTEVRFVNGATLCLRYPGDDSLGCILGSHRRRLAGWSVYRLPNGTQPFRGREALMNPRE